LGVKGIEATAVLLQNPNIVREFSRNISSGAPTMTHEPSLKIVHTLMDPETRKALSLPMAALITGALSQVEATIELTNRVCDSVFHRLSTTTTAAMKRD
jgi:hypothetical protein